jgi:hypothetical protein
MYLYAYSTHISGDIVPFKPVSYIMRQAIGHYNVEQAKLNYYPQAFCYTLMNIFR